MHQSLRGFVAERVNRKESVPESLNAGLEEALDLVIQIEKPDAQKLPHFFTDRRFSDTTDAFQKYAHLYSLSVVLFLSEQPDKIVVRFAHTIYPYSLATYLVI